jgi:hypothetical protein
MKVAIRDPDRARACVQWLHENVGPIIRGTTGSVIRGEGWTAHVQFRVDSDDPIAKIELNQHVDEQDAFMFMLKWSEG